MLGEHIDDPEPFTARPGFFGWLRPRLRDRVGWRSVGYLVLKVPWTLLGFFVAFSLWWDAFVCFTHTFLLLGRGQYPGLRAGPRPCSPSTTSNGTTGSRTKWPSLFGGLIFFFAAPWVMRGFVNVDRLLMRSFLGPDPMATRVRSLEQARTQTVDASAATLRRIERDLHDGTQAQLVALAMRLGMAKEKLADGGGDIDLDRVRQLVDEAHRGAKEAIAELRDIARGIHPPALDIGLEGALATLAARSAVPTELTVDLRTRPTPGHRGHRLLLRGRAAGQRGPARAGLAGLGLVRAAGHMAAPRRARRRLRRGAALHGRVVVERPGRPHRPGPCRGRPPDLVSPPGGPTVVTVDLPLAV